MDVERAIGFAREVGFPRRVGTPGEREALELAEAGLRRAGLEPRRERFPVGLVARELGGIVAFGGCLAVLGATLAALSRWPAAAVPLGMLGAWMGNAPWRVSRWLAERSRSRLWSTNLVAEWRPPGPEATARVVFMAHHDSKSQRLPTGVRVGCVAAVVIGFLGLALLGFLVALGVNAPVRSIATVVAVPQALALLALVFNRTGNTSPGVLDNASGLAVLMELARWRPRPGAALEVAWVATGAEEVGLDGARAFLQAYEWWWSEKPTLLVNLDSVGAGSFVRLAGEPSAVALAERAADRLGIPTRRFSVVGAGMDHEPFAARGLPSLTLLGDVVGTSMHLHTPRDDERWLDPRAFDRAARLAMALADDLIDAIPAGSAFSA